MYNIILYFYRVGQYSEEDVRQFVSSGQITEEQYVEITKKGSDEQ